MSAEPTVVTARHFRYIAERTTQEDAFLRDLRSAATAAGIPAIWICAEEAAFLQVLLRLRGGCVSLQVRGLLHRGVAGGERDDQEDGDQCGGMK